MRFKEREIGQNTNSSVNDINPSQHVIDELAHKQNTNPDLGRNLDRIASGVAQSANANANVNGNGNWIGNEDRNGYKPPIEIPFTGFDHSQEENNN